MCTTKHRCTCRCLFVRSFMALECELWVSGGFLCVCVCDTLSLRVDTSDAFSSRGMVGSLCGYHQRSSTQKDQDIQLGQLDVPAATGCSCVCCLASSASNLFVSHL